MTLDQCLQFDTYRPTFGYNGFAMNPCLACPDGSAEQQCRHRVVHRSRVRESVDSEGGEVCRHPGLERSNVVATEDGGPAQSGYL